MLTSILAYLAIFGALTLLALAALQALSRYRRRFLARTEERVDSLFLGVRPERVWLMALLGATVGALLLGLAARFSVVPVLLGATIGFLGPRFYLTFMERQRRRKFDAQLLEAISLIAGAMRAGMSLLQAMERVTREIGPPLRQEFAHALQENQLGKPLIEALQEMRNRVRSDDLSITVNAIGIAQQTGGVLSDLLLKLAETIRARNRIRGRIVALSAQGRLQGMVMALLPWAFALIMYALDPALMRPMFTTTTGQIALAGIAVLEILGWSVIRRLVAIDA